MINATIRKVTGLALSLVIVAAFSGHTHAQNPSFDDGKFVFFINGVNVQVPTIDGTVTNDPAGVEGNKVFEIAYADWSEQGFRWPSNGVEGTVGVDASGAVGQSYGESDTLYIRIWSDSSNFGQNDFIAFFDTENGGSLGDDLPFRARWYIPNYARNEQWWDFAIPLPPATTAGFDSMNAGVDINGDSLTVEVDTLMQYWGYGGAWAASDAAGCFDTALDCWQEFQWNSVKYFGRHVDHASGGGSVYIDYMSIGVPPEDLVDEAPAAVTGLEVTNDAGVNTVAWSASAGAGGYNVYFSESEITDVSADGVALLGPVAFDATTSYDHTIEAPHQDLASNFTAYYAVTAVSNFGSESAVSAGMISADVNTATHYVVELSSEAVDAVFDAIDTETMPTGETLASFFPDTYVPFTIDADRKIIENGGGGDDDADISGQFWIGYGGELNELIIYAEISDDALNFSPIAAAAGAEWPYDNWEMGLGNYSPESFIIGSTHGTYFRGEDPDYQFRAGMRSGEDPPFIFASGLNDFVPFSATIGETNDTGYRLLTFIDTFELTKTEDMDDEFVFPESDEVATYPMNIALNDNDNGTSRDTQVSWSLNAGGDNWWNNPTRFQVVAFVGANKVVATNNEDEGSKSELTFELEQNYPNPFNPTTNIRFTLANATDVTLEVYNLLGQKVATLLQNEKMTAGQHSHNFDASSLSSGMYLYKISTPNFVQSRKMMLIK